MSAYHGEEIKTMAIYLTLHVRGIVMCKRQESLCNPEMELGFFKATGCPIHTYFSTSGCISSKVSSATPQGGCRTGSQLCEMDPVEAMVTREHVSSLKGTGTMMFQTNAAPCFSPPCSPSLQLSYLLSYELPLVVSPLGK